MQGENGLSVHEPDARSTSLLYHAPLTDKQGGHIPEGNAPGRYGSENHRKCFLMFCIHGVMVAWDDTSIKCFF